MFAATGNDVQNEECMVHFVPGGERGNFKKLSHIPKIPVFLPRDSRLATSFFPMRPLHIQLLVTDPEREDVVSLRDALRAAGHVVVAGEVQHVPEGVGPGPDFVIAEGAAVPTPASMEAAETRHINAVLRFTGGNKRQAALLLGIARSTLLAKIRKYGLT